MNKFTQLKREIIEKEFSNLNDMQKKAAFHINGPLLIIAGAGSGKTTTMVNRIAYLIRFGNAYNDDSVDSEFTENDLEQMQAYLDGVAEPFFDVDSLIASDPAKPWQILAITFTNKAANELKDRLSIMLGSDISRDIWASTFHSCCAKILRRYADRLGYTSSFTIYDTDDTKRVIKECQRLHHIDERFLSYKTILGKISDAKNYLLSPEECLRQSENGEGFNPLMASLYKQYQTELKNANAMDFDDLIFNTVALLENDSEVREYYQRKFKYVMVDEYQDTNFAQFRLTQLIADGWGNICVVGDDDQSIYKFRGATIENILGFEKQFKNCMVIRLEQNYRSTQTILDAANAVISHNQNRKGKTLWTDNGEGEKIVSYLASDQNDEAEYIVSQIIKDVDNGIPYSSHAVLYRANALSNAIELHFARNGIPYRIFGGHRFYERAEIRDILAYLTVISNTNDNSRLMRIINVPARGIGQKTAEKILDLSSVTGKPVFDIISHADEYNALQRSASKLISFSDMILELQEYVDEVSLPELLEKVLEKVSYIDYLESDKEKGKDRIENIRELSSNLITYENENGDDATLQGFLEEVSLLTDIDNYNEQADAAVLMTMHSSKGLEFPVVFLPGMEERVFPGAQSVNDPVEIEEERRLAYVAITRAKQKLFLLRTERRLLYGNTDHNALSRFLNEIPEDLLHRVKSTKLTSVYSSFNYSSKSGAENHSYSDRYRTPTPYITPMKTKPGKVDFKVGERVKSPNFGEGTVLSCTPMASDAIVEVAFDRFGTKKLMAKYAKLDPI